MATEESDQMMALLQELALLKDMDARFEANPVDSERHQSRLRQQRKQEIGEEMKALAEQKQKAQHTQSEHLPPLINGESS